MHGALHVELPTQREEQSRDADSKENEKAADAEDRLRRKHGVPRRFRTSARLLRYEHDLRRANPLPLSKQNLRATNSL